MIFMKIIMIILAAMIIIAYNQTLVNKEFSHKSLLPYSNIDRDEDDDIVTYGVKKISSKYNVTNITIKVKDCNESVAGKYIPASKSIIICKNFINYIKYYYKYLKLEDYNKSVNATILFILYHEYAHMFDDIYDLPIVGNEEIAADQFAALNLLDDYMLYNYLEAYKQLIDDANDIPAWDEHPTYRQHYYNLVCLLYGYDSDTYSKFKEELHNRAERCDYEYNSISTAWSELLN